MKIFNSIATIAGVIFLLGALSPVHAGDKLSVFEMGESGQTVTFPKSAKELAVDDARDRARQAAQSKIERRPAAANQTTYDIGDGGHIVSFPMTAEEMKQRDAALERRASLRANSTAQQAPQVDVFEMGESGQTVTFPRAVKTSDLEFAGKKTDRQ